MRRVISTFFASATVVIITLAARGWPPSNILDAFTAIFLGLGIAIGISLVQILYSNSPMKYSGGGVEVSTKLPYKSDTPISSSDEPSLPDPLNHGLEPPLL